MVTAETALSLPAVILVLLMVLAAASAGVTQLRVADAARTAARQAAIGQEDYAGAAQRVADHLQQPLPHQPRQRGWRIQAKRAILAAGAIERPGSPPR